MAGTPIDEAVSSLIVKEMGPVAVDMALEIRKEIEARYAEADQLRSRAVEHAQVDADLAQRRFMMVDPNNRLVADTLEANWNEKLRALAKVRDERERAGREDRAVVDEGIRERLIAMTADFTQLWADPSVANRERKRMLAYIIEDATLLKNPDDETTKVHIRFKGGRIETLTTKNPKPSWQKVKTSSEIVKLVDRLLDDHLYAEIACILNAKGFQPGGAAWPGKQATRFNALRVQYLAHTYGLRSRSDRLRDRGMLTKNELASRLGIHVHTLTSWAKHGIVRTHAYSQNRCLYEQPARKPTKHCSRWDRLADRAATIREENKARPKPSSRNERGAV